MAYDTETKTTVQRAIWALLGLTVSGVISFSVYVVRDVKEDVMYIAQQHHEMEEYIKKIQEQVTVNTVRLTQVEREMVSLRQSVLYRVTPRGEGE